MNLDLSAVPEKEAGWYNELRQRLGLPVPESIDPSQLADATKTPLARLDRLQTEKLTDEQLAILHRRANMNSYTRATVRLSWEIVRRPEYHGSTTVHEALVILANLAEETDAVLKHLDAARESALKKRESSALWDLLELNVRLRRREIDEFSRLAHHIAAEHMREPGVSETFGQIMASAGLVDAEGRILIPRRQAPTSPILVPGGAGSGKILTSESACGAPANRPAIWTPGME